MKLEKIISLANKSSELRFKAMVRSLRATGCNLPVWVIPYDENKFELPENCIWWEITELTAFLAEQQIHPMLRKFQCFITDNYQFVDADIVFLKNPAKELANLTGFITSCCHWNNPWYTYTPSTLQLFRLKSTTWQKSVFNAGQFACDIPLYTIQQIMELSLNPAHQDIFTSHDQFATNLFVFLSGVNITNITLPPFKVESTWAGDYEDDQYERYWTDESKKPYLIHWAGCRMDVNRPIDQLFTDHLTAEEKQIWDDRLAQNSTSKNRSLIDVKLFQIKNRMKKLFTKF